MHKKKREACKRDPRIAITLSRFFSFLFFLSSSCLSFPLRAVRDWRRRRRRRWWRWWLKSVRTRKSKGGRPTSERWASWRLRCEKWCRCIVNTLRSSLERVTVMSKASSSRNEKRREENKAALVDREHALCSALLFFRRKTINKRAIATPNLFFFSPEEGEEKKLTRRRNALLIIFPRRRRRRRRSINPR